MSATTLADGPRFFDCPAQEAYPALCTSSVPQAREGGQDWARVEEIDGVRFSLYTCLPVHPSSFFPPSREKPRVFPPGGPADVFSRRLLLSSSFGTFGEKPSPFAAGVERMPQKWQEGRMAAIRTPSSVRVPVLSKHRQRTYPPIPRREGAVQYTL